MDDTMVKDNKAKVFNFMDKINDLRDAEKEEERFKNSNTYKLRILDKNKELMRNHCIDRFCKHMYRDAVPIGDEFKSAHMDDLDNTYDEFIKSRCPKGLTFYVREGLKKGSPFAKKLLECVENLVNEEYFDKELNIEDTPLKEIEFNPEGMETKKRIKNLEDRLSAPEISVKLYDMAKKTAEDQITRAKDTKHQMEQLQDELSNDVNIRTRGTLESVLELRDITTKKTYNPTLFEGINIFKLNTLKPKFESGDSPYVQLQDSLSIYTENEMDPNKAASLNELAFIESVEEYTALLMSKVLKLESFNKYDVNDLANDYAQRR